MYSVASTTSQRGATGDFETRGGDVAYYEISISILHIRRFLGGARPSQGLTDRYIAAAGSKLRGGEMEYPTDSILTFIVGQPLSIMRARLDHTI